MLKLNIKIKYKLIDEIVTNFDIINEKLPSVFKTNLSRLLKKNY